MSKVSICAVGDVAAFFTNPESMFVHCAAALKDADITFGQNERFYTDTYGEQHLIPSVPFTEIAPRSHASALRAGGFDVMSFASNHCMDLGGDAMMETIGALRENGFTVIGAGRNSEEARRPAIVERNGVKVAFLAYASVLRPGWEAGPTRPGCAPVRARTFYQQVDYQPGTAPAIISMAYPEDLHAMLEDVKRVRAQADIVVASFHWGVHYSRGVIATYQREVAHAAIDAGVDVIVGHHPHELKGVEVYRGKPIFYSMGNFAFDLPLSLRKARQALKPEKDLQKPIVVDPEYADHYSWPAESRKSMIVRIVASGKRLERVSFLPVLINTKAQPVVVSDAAQLDEALRNIEDLSTGHGFTTGFALDGSEIVVRH